MKKSLLALAIALSASAAFAQTVSPTQLCQRVSSISGSNGSICAQLIAHNSFDPAAIHIANSVLSQGSTYAVGVLRETANRRVDTTAGELCGSIGAISGTNTVNCAKAVADKLVSPELVRIGQAVASQGSTYVVAAAEAGADAYLFAPLAEVCERMGRISGTNTVRCVETIANKVSMNGSEQVCMTSISQGSSYALQCLQNIVVNYTPIPQPTTIMVELYQLHDLKRELLKARAQLNRGMIQQAERTIQDASFSVDQMMNGRPVR